MGILLSRFSDGACETRDSDLFCGVSLLGYRMVWMTGISNICLRGLPLLFCVPRKIIVSNVRYYSKSHKAFRIITT